MSYWAFVILTLAIGLVATAVVNSSLKKYAKVRSSLGLTGAEVAKRMLSHYGISNVLVKSGGQGQDFYDPRTNSITLSPQAYASTSITAIATACHEAGHACQYAQGYTPMKVRGSLVPAVNLCSNIWIFVLLIGAFAHMNDLVLAAVILYAAVVIFELVTLPVEFNASRRAIGYLQTIRFGEAELGGAKRVLSSCALTYVAAALTSILQLLWILGQSRD